LGGGIDGFSLQLKDKVVKAAQDLRLDQDLAVELLKANVIKVFMNYVKQAKSKSTRLDQAKELKKMVYFSNLVVQPLLEGIKPPTAEEIEAEKAQAEIAKIMKEAQAAAKKEEEEEKAADDPKSAPPLPLAVFGGACKGYGIFAEVVKNVLEGLDTFVGRYLAFLSIAYIAFKWAHFRLFNDFPPF